MNEINRIQSYTTGVSNRNFNNNNKKQEKISEQPQNLSEPQEDKSEKVLDALDMLGARNMTGISKAINPADYLSPERIAEIEASMAQFEQGVQAQAVALENEFGHLPEFSQMPEAEKNAMAAQSFAAISE